MKQFLLKNIAPSKRVILLQILWNYVMLKYWDTSFTEACRVHIVTLKVYLLFCEWS